MKRLFKWVMIACGLVKLLSTVLFFVDSRFQDLLWNTCAFGILYGFASCFADNRIEPAIGALMVLLEVSMLPIFLLVGAVCKKEKVLRCSAIVLGALGLVDAVSCVASMWMMPLPFKTVNLVFSLVYVVICIITAALCGKKSPETLS